MQLIRNLVSPAASARNLGVVFDHNFTLKKHIDNVCRNCNYHLRDFKRIRKHLDISTATSLANALVNSRLDYCNSLFSILTDEFLTKLQRVQNSLARTVTKSRLVRSADCPSASGLLKRLHWLPIRSRIAFKINLITYKALNTGLPVYIKEVLQPRPYERSLRANDTCMLAKGPLVRKRSGLSSFLFVHIISWTNFPNQYKMLLVYYLSENI